MKIAITGGTGFVGRHLARALAAEGHEVVLIARGVDRRDPELASLPGVRLAVATVADEEALAAAFAGCEAVAHCAGINRELGAQTYEHVHRGGTAAVTRAARRAGVRRIVLLSFLRARPRCGSPYHESKWDAEELVRASGLDYTVVKAGVIYGRGDHLLDHLSHSLHTTTLFGLVGLAPVEIAPVAVEDLVAILRAALAGNEPGLLRKTVAVVGPERLSLREVVSRVGEAVGRRPRFVRLPTLALVAFAWLLERVMRVPLISMAQVRILAEGAALPLAGVDVLPPALLPQRRFTLDQIRRGLPAAGRFGRADLRWNP